MWGGEEVGGHYIFFVTVVVGVCVCCVELEALVLNVSMSVNNAR